MAEHTVCFEIAPDAAALDATAWSPLGTVPRPVRVPTGTLVVEAARLAGADIQGSHYGYLEALKWAKIGRVWR